MKKIEWKSKKPKEVGTVRLDFISDGERCHSCLYEWTEIHETPQIYERSDAYGMWCRECFLDQMLEWIDEEKDSKE
jgi:hypothetical protein